MRTQLLRTYGLRFWILALFLGLGFLVGTFFAALKADDPSNVGNSLVLLAASFAFLSNWDMKLEHCYRPELLSLPLTPRTLWRHFIAVWLLRLGMYGAGVLAGMQVKQVADLDTLGYVGLGVLGTVLFKAAQGRREFRVVLPPGMDELPEEQDNLELTWILPFIFAFLLAFPVAQYLGPWFLAPCLLLAIAYLVLHTPLPMELETPVWLRSKRPRGRNYLSAPVAAAASAAAAPARQSVSSTSIPAPGKRDVPKAIPKARKPFHLGHHLLKGSFREAGTWWIGLAVLHFSGLGTGLPKLFFVLVLIGWALHAAAIETAKLEPLPLDRRHAFDWSIGLPLGLGLLCIALPATFREAGEPSFGFRLLVALAVTWLGVAGWMEGRRTGAAGEDLQSRLLRGARMLVLSAGAILLLLALALRMFRGPTLGGFAETVPSLPHPTGEVAGWALLPLSLGLCAWAWWDLRHRYRGVHLSD
ncbi:MAG: hypothetical protein GY930_07865 [bacterium]|nr:hypothetical protein [bacterium]